LAGNAYSTDIRLDTIFNDKVTTESPQQNLDEIYTRILKFSVIRKAIEEEKADIYRFLHLALSNLLSVPKARIDKTLRGLHSVFAVPQNEASSIHLLHLSFRDFLIGRDV
jgi:hypothetical protein